MEKKYNIAIVGATGMVGGEFLRVLEQRKFPVKGLHLLASGRSRGKKLKFCGKNYKVEELLKSSFNGIDIALFSAGADISKIFSPIAAKVGCVVIDNSSAFRMDRDVPLVVPEVNPHALGRHRGIIANPNCSTIQLVMVLKPIHDAVGIKRIVVSTYQSASGWGKEAVDQLWAEAKAAIRTQSWRLEVGSSKRALPAQIAFNVIPQIDSFLPDGYTKEEQKIVNETRKILEDDSIKITATCVRVPVVIGHSEAVNIQTEKKLIPEQAREILSYAPGIRVIDDIASQRYPLPIDAAGEDLTFVGRIRSDESTKFGLNLWIVSDNLRKGAALNAVQIAELLIKDKF